MSPRARRAVATVLRLHLPLVLGVAVCLFAGWVELSRARAGHTIAWVYAVEWPMFAVAGVVMWWRILTGRDTEPEDRGTRGPKQAIPDDDPDLQAWRRYRAGIEQARPEERGDAG